MLWCTDPPILISHWSITKRHHRKWVFMECRLCCLLLLFHHALLVELQSFWIASSAIFITTVVRVWNSRCWKVWGETWTRTSMYAQPVINRVLKCVHTDVMGEAKRHYSMTYFCVWWKTLNYLNQKWYVQNSFGRQRRAKQNYKALDVSFSAD